MGCSMNRIELSLSFFKEPEKYLKKLDWRVGAIGCLALVLMGAYLLSRKKPLTNRIQQIQVDQLEFTRNQLNEVFNGTTREQACQEILNLVNEAFMKKPPVSSIILDRTIKESPIVKYQHFSPSGQNRYELLINKEIIKEQNFVQLVLSILRKKKLIKNFWVSPDDYILRIR